MKIKIKDLDRLIEILSKKREELINEERDKQIDLSDVLRQQPYTPKKSFPEKWAILITENNYVILNSYLHENSKNYKNYVPSFNINIDDAKRGMYFYSSNDAGCKGYGYEKYELITEKEFLENIYLPF